VLPVTISLTPSPSLSLQLGTVQQFTASALNNTNSHINPTFTFSLSPDSQSGILDVAPNGAACAGNWNAPLYSICSPGTSGAVQVIASALGASSAPTWVFVHPAIAKISISVVPPVNAPPPACPTQTSLPAACAIKFNQRLNCFSPNQAETLKATSLDSQGNDISVYVGPVTWTATNFGVATLTPIVNPTYSVSTNQVTVTPGTPGQTEIVAQASGVYSEITPASMPGSFFEACPVQCIALDVGTNGTFTGVTSFTVPKGTAETITAYAVDIQGCLLPKPPLTWTSSEPAAIAAGSSTVTCATGTTCALSTTQQGAAAITASCTPPSCNVGYPLNLSPGIVAPYIPQPVYPVTAISGLVTGTSPASSVLATSQDCYSNPLCGVAMYNVPTSTNVSGSPLSVPTPPNSLMFDGAGDKAYVGSEFGAQLITVANIGSNTMNPFSPLPAPATTLGALTGKILAVSPNGNLALFADNVSNPNQVYVVNTGATPATTTPLNISSAITAAFSPDGLKAFILGNGGDTLYIYSTLQALQPAIALPAPATAVVFNSTGSFALLAGGAMPGELSVYNTCDNSTVTLNPASLVPPPTTPLPATPIFLKLVPGGNVTQGTALIPDLNPVGLDFFFGVDNTGVDIIATNSTQPPTTALCPQSVALAASTVNNLPRHIDLDQGPFHPINFFVSPDATQVYIVTSDLGVLLYNFSTGAVQAIPLSGGAAPVAADITVDGSLIYVAGTDGKLHQLVTQTASEQEMPISFFALPNSSNSFCPITNHQISLRRSCRDLWPRYRARHSRTARTPGWRIFARSRGLH
jgi:hypothetical protein